jgi:hypothetical protein
VQYCEQAFTQDAKLAGDLKAEHRFHAACAAALAAAGQDPTSPKPDEAELARLRGLALKWLSDDLAAWPKTVAQFPQAMPFARGAMVLWRETADLASVREEQAIAALPAEEQAAWQGLWKRVADLDKMLAGKKD